MLESKQQRTEKKASVREQRQGRRAEGMVWIGAGLMNATHSYPARLLRTTCTRSA